MPDNIVKSGEEGPAREYWLNADFDRSLGGNASLLETADATYVHEMAWHFLFAGEDADSLLVHRPLPSDFLAYLQSKGFALPRVVVHPEFTREAEFWPFGWSRQTTELADRYANPPAHPKLEAVRKANSRAFCLELEKSLDGSCAGDFCDNAESLADRLFRRPASEVWVLKGDHGYAGAANHRLPGGPIASEDRNRVEAIFAEHGGAVLEPWHTRLLDMAVLFNSSPQGSVEDFRGHALLNSRDGAFLGVQIAPDMQPPGPWCDALRENAVNLGRALAAIGYYGPVGVDSYVHQTQDGPCLRPLVDVNARLSMALPAHGLARRLPGRHVLWTWTKPRKLNLPADYPALDAALGPNAFNASASRGILAVSPIKLKAGPRRGPEDAQRPRRVGFALVAEDEADMARLREAFSRALGRA